MTVFHIDVHDGRTFVPDDCGTSFASLEAAREQAVRTLLIIALGTLPTDEDRAFVATVRSVQGDPVHQAKLSFSSTKLA